jgi:hypothetical protein
MSIALALILAANATLSPPPDAPLPPGEQSPIVVQGQRASERQIRNFIRELTPARPRGQLGRFESPVCPAAAGLSPAQNELVKDRLRRVADAAGMAVAKAKCHPNVIVVVTPDKAALLKRMGSKRADYFPIGQSGFDYHDIFDPDEPVAAWQIEQTRGIDGRKLHEVRNSAEVGMDGVMVQRLHGSATRITPMARQEFSGAVVVVQADAIVGLTTTQLADYAAMRAFVRTDPGKLTDAAANSILNVITTPMGEPVPLTLTAWDMSFLKAYYASRLNSFAANQRSEMRQKMRQDLGGQEEPAQ